jgi:hypothetical protein
MISAISSIGVSLMGIASSLRSAQRQLRTEILSLKLDRLSVGRPARGMAPGFRAR